MEALMAEVAADTYNEILAHVPMKIEAKYKQKVLTLCGDDETLIKKHNLAFSDSRAAIGFYNRIYQFRNDPKKVGSWLKAFAETYKMDHVPTVDEALKRSKENLKAAVGVIRDLFEKRNQHFVNAIKNSKVSESVLVIGGAHVADLKVQLERAGVGCTVVEPVGYDPNDETLLEQLEKLVSK